MSVFTMKASSNCGGGPGEWTPPQGNHQAVLVALVDLGTHSESFQGQPAKTVRKIYLAWELVEEPASGLGRNHTICEKYTLSFNSKAKFRKLIEDWTGKKFSDGEEYDPTKLLGERCMVNVIHTPSGEYVNANVGTITPVHKSLPAVAGKIKPLLWFIGCGDDVPEHTWLPKSYGKSVKDLIAASREMGGQPAAVGNGRVNADDDGHTDDTITF